MIERFAGLAQHPCLARLLLAVLMSMTAIQGAAAADTCLSFFWLPSAFLNVTLDKPQTPQDLEQARRRISICNQEIKSNPPNLHLHLERRGQAYIVTGQYDLALADGKRCAAIWDQRVDRHKFLASWQSCHEIVGLAHVGLRQFDDAIAAFRKCDSIKHSLVYSLTYPLGTYELKAKHFLEKGDDLSASQAYEAVLRLPGVDKSIIKKFNLDLAFAYQRLGELDKAIAAYDTLLQYDPQDTESYFSRGRLRARKNDLRGAFTDLSIAVGQMPAEAEYVAERGKIWLARGNTDDAIADFSKAIALEPSAGNYALRAQAYHIKGNIDAALADLNEMIKRDAKSAEAFFTRGIVLAKRDLRQALADFDNAIRLNARNPTYYNLHGIVQGASAGPDKALADYAKAIVSAPTDAEGYLLRAWALLRVGKPQDALRDASRAVALEPKMVAPFVTRSRIYQALGKAAEAAADLTTARANAAECQKDKRC